MTLKQILNIFSSLYPLTKVVRIKCTFQGLDFLVRNFTTSFYFSHYSYEGRKAAAVGSVWHNQTLCIEEKIRRLKEPLFQNRIQRHREGALF